ncbi:MAG: type II toxin-antitoxin system VapC family toxin [Chloroflexota bacterium]
MTIAVSPRRRRLWRVVDASVWVSRYVTADVNHAASHAWLYQHLSTGSVIIAPALLLVEVSGAIARRTGDIQRTRQITLRLRQLPGVRWVSITTQVRDHAADLASRLRLRGADAIYVALADRLKIPLITWDSEQLTRATPLIIARTP